MLVIDNELRKAQGKEAAIIVYPLSHTVGEPVNVVLWIPISVATGIKTATLLRFVTDFTDSNQPYILQTEKGFSATFEVWPKKEGQLNTSVLEVWAATWKQFKISSIPAALPTPKDVDAFISRDLNILPSRNKFKRSKLSVVR